MSLTVGAPFSMSIPCFHFHFPDYDTLLKKLTQDLADKTNALKTVEINLKSLISTPKTDSAKTKTDEIKKGIETLEKRLETLKTSTEVISVEEKKNVLNDHDKLLREYR